MYCSFESQIVIFSEPDYQDKIMTLTEGKGAPVIMEMLGNVNLDADMKMMSNGGRTCVIGSRGEVQVSPRDLMIKETYVTGVILPAASPVKFCHFSEIK